VSAVVVVADAFAGVDALGREGRAALAKILRCPADGLETAPVGDLGDRRHRQRLVAAVVAAVEPQPVLSALSGRALSELAPAAGLLPDGELAAARCPARLVRHLRDHVGGRWSSVLALRLGDALEWCGVGPRAAAALVGLAVERGLDGLAERSVGGRAARVLGDLEAVVRYEDAKGYSMVRSALLELSGGPHPEGVRRSASRLLASAGQVGGGADLEDALDAVLAAAGDARDQAIFAARELSLPTRPSLEQLARRVRLSPERVRQLRIRAVERVRAAAEAAPEGVAGLAVEVRGRLGVAARAADAGAFLTELGLSQTATTARNLVLWLAGPYHPVRGLDGWLATEAEDIVGRTRQLLSEDGGTRLATAVGADLAALGVVEGQRDGWLVACGGRRVDDMVVWTSGTTGDIIERLLFATGTPMTAAELASLMPDGGDRVAAVLRRDGRFVGWEGRAGAFGLAEWCAPAAPDAPPGARQLPLVEPDHKDGGLASIDGAYWLRVAVDEALLAGRSQPAPADLASAVGLAAGHRRTFAGRFGPVSLVDDDGEGRLETLRPVALACGAAVGDTLRLGFSPDGKLTVKLHAGGSPASDQALAQGGS